LIRILNKSKRATFVGRLPDNEKFSSGSILLRERRYKVQDSLYKRQKRLFGILQGFASYQGANGLRGGQPGISSQLRWEKKVGADPEYYPAGFVKTAFLDAVTYPVPRRGDLVPTFVNKPMNARIEITKGDLAAPDEPIVADVTLTASSGKVVGLNPYGIKIKVDPRNGQFSGSFMHPQLGRKVTFAGGFKVQLIATGKGSFQGETQAGRVTILKQ
jgi:hypothetical protein